MPERFVCLDCEGVDFFRQTVHQIDTCGNTLNSHADWLSCLACGKTYFAKNQKVFPVDPIEKTEEEEGKE